MGESVGLQKPGFFFKSRYCGKNLRQLPGFFGLWERGDRSWGLNWIKSYPTFFHSWGCSSKCRMWYDSLIIKLEVISRYRWRFPHSFPSRYFLPRRFRFSRFCRRFECNAFISGRIGITEVYSGITARCHQARSILMRFRVLMM